MSRIAYLGAGAGAELLARRLAASHDAIAIDRAGLGSMSQCRVLVINLRADPEVDEVLFGTQGLATRLARGAVVIDQTPGDPDDARRRYDMLRERGVSLLDAPIHCERFDTFPEAAALLCGGAADTVASVRDVLESLCPKVVHCGESGSGRVARLVVAAVAACNRMVTLECATIGFKNGLSLGDMAKVLDGSSGYNHAIARVLPALESGDRTADVDLGAAVADLKLAAELGKRSGAPMLTGNLVCSLFEGAAAMLGADQTIDAMARIYETTAGVKFAPDAANAPRLL